jgi:beta-glucuronidase
LYPHCNPFRQVIDLSGFWDLRFDPEGQGDQSGWAEGFAGGRPVAVPASWNDQFEDGRDFLGPAWYQTHFDLPWGWDAARQRIALRFGSVNYMTEVWLNGVRLGQHEGGHLPFEFDVTSQVRSEGNPLSCASKASWLPTASAWHVPPDPQHMFVDQRENWPSSFDFFPFCGIHRPVLLYATAPDGISGLSITADLAGSEGQVHVQVKRAADDTVSARLTLKGHGADIAVETSVATQAQVGLTVPDAALWAPGSPCLYDLTVELARHGAAFDCYQIPVGIRTIKVEGDALLLNGKPIYLKGFGRHEDFPITGRGLAPAVVVKDYALMEWVGANSFRTTHYPYSEQIMTLADRLGFMVIDETPAVGLFFAQQGLERRLQLCRQYIQELIDRDMNHPSVILWSLANEPHSDHPAAKAFFRNLYDLTRSLDPSRPASLVSHKGVQEESFEFCDVLTLNRYGW